MSKIKLMNKELRNLIAAGEVVERPASVVKELLENSIDAGGTFITVEIANGGRTLIRVTDNGCGIAREDITLAFVSHATSKLKTAEDLDSIGTLGFRGEALSSIAAVSKVNLLTKTAEEEYGTSVSACGSEVSEPIDAGCPDGTTIIINELFFNTPARMKFLKSDTGEANAVAGIVDKIAISHPEISIKFIRDNKTVYQTTGDGNLRFAVTSVYGKELSDGLVDVDYRHNGIRVTGLTSKPMASRKSRSMQNFFLNGRYIRTKTGYAALDEAYKNSIMVGKHPSCFLNIIIPPDRVDVNVHPAKTEVRFDNESLIFDAVRFAVKTALMSGDTRPEMTISGRDNFKNILRENEGTPVQKKIAQAITDVLKSDTIEKSGTDINKSDRYKKESDISDRIDSFENVALGNNIYIKKNYSENAEDKSENRYIKNNEPSEQHELPRTEIIQELSEPEIEPKFVGEAFDTYIITEYGKDLLFIDKHAAHERLIYEQLRSGIIDDGGRQLFLEPMSINLPKNEYDAIVANLNVLADAGFEADDFGDGTILLRSVPSMLFKEDAKAAIEEIADRFVNNKKDVTTQKLDWIYHSIACRSAVKGGNKSTADELIKIAEKALQDDIRYCPHGRPVAIILKKSEIEKQFGRIK